MTRIIEKRRSLHSRIAHQKAQNQQLKLQLSQLQALANIGICTSMIAHEINNLLTPLANYADLALANPDDKALIDKALSKTAKNASRATEVMQSILAVANGETLQKKPVNLRQVIDEIFSCLCRDFTKDRIAVQLDVPENLTLNAVPVEIQQVLMNLILNARDAMLPAGGTLTIKARQLKACIQIHVSDTGCGIPPENLDKIFEPFFTTKAADKNQKAGGSGLGLAFCNKIVENYNGTISVDSQPGATTFNIILPNS